MINDDEIEQDYPIIAEAPENEEYDCQSNKKNFDQWSVDSLI